MIGGSTMLAGAVPRPLHRRADSVPIAEMDIITHAYLVAVIDHWGTRHRQQEPVHQFHPAPVMLQKRRKSAPDAEIEPGAPIGRVSVPEIVALGVRHHLQSQLVVIAQKNRPLS